MFGAPPQIPKMHQTERERYILSTTFFGFEKPMLLPPNVCLSGPVFNYDEGGTQEMMDRLKEKDPDLFQWICDAEAKSESLIYITIGSECLWKEWSIKAVYEGTQRLLKKHKLRFIWSLPGDHTLPCGEKNDQYWSSKWLPQVEILSHPSTVAGLSHCGFGGVLEFMQAGLPMACFPHFADQGTNAQNMVDAGAGIFLTGPMDMASMEDETVHFYFDKPKFTAD